MNPARELERLIELRDLRAYDCVEAVRQVVVFWEAQSYEDSLDHLKHALDRFRAADKAVTDFYNSISKLEPDSKIPPKGEMRHAV